MKLIAKTTITDAMLISTDVTEADYSEYDVSTTYGDGDTVIETASGVHRIYESLQAANTGNALPVLPATATAWWLEISATNRWKVFDGIIGTQTGKATSMQYLLSPGAFDSIALLNLSATDAEIYVYETSGAGANHITNGTDWTGATGTTPPTGWASILTPSNYTIDTGAIRITTNAAHEGMYQRPSVADHIGSQMVLQFDYKNTSGDVAEYAIFDVTHSLDIVANTHLASSTSAFTTMKIIFTVPAGCNAVDIKFLANGVGDIVWFDNVSLYVLMFHELVGHGSASTVNSDLVFLSIPAATTPYVDIAITYTAGTAKCGMIVCGTETNIGTSRYAPSFGITDYSQKVVDAYGNYTVTPGAYSKTMSIPVYLANTSLNSVVTTLVAYRAIAAVWVGHEDYSPLIIYGYYRDLSLTIPYKDYSLYDITIEGLI
jgi:hypothetical protein